MENELAREFTGLLYRSKNLPMEARQLKEISEKVYSNLQALVPADIKTIEGILKKETIKYGKIRTFGLEDSQEIVLLTMKQNCLILVKYLLENEIMVPEHLLSTIYSLVSLKSGAVAGESGAAQRKPDLQAQIEKERIVDEVQNLLVDIVCISKYTNGELVNFLKTKSVPDKFLANLAIAVDMEVDCSSFELTVLSKRLLGPVFLSLVKSYRNDFRKLTRNKIIDVLKKKTDTKEREIVFEVFYHLNSRPNRELLASTHPEGTAEYFGFVCSLLQDGESVEMGYKKLEGYIEDLWTALQTILTFPRGASKEIQPQDERMILRLLECMSKMVKYKPMNFIRFISVFQNVLKTRVSREVKGVIYDILGQYVEERDMFIDKIVECRDEVEREIRVRDFFLLPRLVRFLNAYTKREQREVELVNAGILTGSPYAVAEERSGVPRCDFRVLGLKSEDPATVIECLGTYMSPSILKLHSAHLRNTMIKDKTVVDEVIAFQIEHQCLIEDIAVINCILSYSSPRFFEYARLFKDFSFYLNGDVLERIEEDIEGGIRWVEEAYTKDFGKFIMRNSTYFNEILRCNSEVQPRIMAIYEKIQNENIDAVEFSIFACEEPKKQHKHILFLSDEHELLNEVFFRIFAKQLIYMKFFKHMEIGTGDLLKRYPVAAYGLYVKAKAVCSQDIMQDIEFMKKNLLVSDEFLGYFVTARLYTPAAGEMSSNILFNFGTKNNLTFLKNFANASDVEKFILFFSIEKHTKEIDLMIRDEIMRNLKNPNRIYLRMCVLQLFKMREIDQILKILEKNFEDKELLFKLCLHNISTGGKYFSQELMQYGNETMKCKAIFMLYYLNIWDREYLKEMIEKLSPEMSSEIKYLVDDIRRR